MMQHFFKWSFSKENASVQCTVQRRNSPNQVKHNFNTLSYMILTMLSELNDVFLMVTKVDSYIS